MKNIFNFLLALSVAVGFTACLKDQGILSPKNVNNVVEFGDISAPVSPATHLVKYYTAAFDLVPLDTLFIPINYAGAKKATEDIVVKIDTSLAVLDSVNKAEKLSLVCMDKNLFSLPSSVVIPAGKQTAHLLIPIKINQLSFTEPVALPLEIKDASGKIISGNYGKIAVRVIPKNKFDGVYRVQGTMTDTRASVLTGDYPRVYELRTVGEASIALYAREAGTFAHLIRNNGSLTYYGTFAPVFEIDLATNKVVSVTNYYGQPAPGNGRYAELDDTGVNKYDPVTKKLTVKYWMGQAGRRTLFDEEFTFVRPR